MAILTCALLATLAFALTSAAPIVRKGVYERVTTVNLDDVVFTVGDSSYLAPMSTPVLTASHTSMSYTGDLMPLTVVTTAECTITAGLLNGTISSYLAGDDVYSEGFLEGLLISSNCSSAKLDSSVMPFVESMGVTSLFLGSSIPTAGLSSSSCSVSTVGPVTIQAGPYAVAVLPGGVAKFSLVYRLFEDFNRDFIFGAYSAMNGSYKPLPTFLPKFQDAMIPVPSRIYTWSDTRPLAGLRVAIKDLYDIAGLQTSGGSRAWATITPTANVTAPAIQQIINLGGQIVGKFKTAQFASGADPWDWIDTQYPFNPRGDGYLTCSASSAGGGCSLASYDWLDNAIGTDTGSSMRRPASVSGTYGNRPSQGMMVLDHVLPLGAAQDTSGVFSRDPHQWAHFAKNYYAPNLHQDPSINGLEPLVINDTMQFPSKIYFPVDYLPVRNPAADALVQSWVANLSVLGIERVNINFTEIMFTDPDPTVSNLSIWSGASGVLNSKTAWEDIGKPLTEAWAAMYDGRYPPLDPAHRNWFDFNEASVSDALYASSLAIKRTFSDWMNYDFLGYNETTCSNALFIYDIGTGGLPSYREEDLITGNPAATLLSYRPPTVKTTGASLCSFAGCPDFTVPIGQVPYYSNVTFHTEMVPVTLNVVARRGCDFMLFNLIAALADKGVQHPVKTGRTPF